MAGRGGVARKVETERMKDKGAELVRLIEENIRAEVKTEEPLAPHSSWKIGGNADIYVRPYGIEAAARLFALLHQYRFPWVILGRGTNVLIPDAGIRGMVVQLNHLDDVRQDAPGCYTAGAGVMLAELVRVCCRNGDSGMEDLAGIPGSMGGAVIMNAGAGEHTLAQVLSGVRMVHRGEVREYKPSELHFGYRSSGVKADMVVLEASVKLHHTSAMQCMRRRTAALEHRRKAQKVRMPNCGSVFRNPPGVSAWKLIDACDLRGFSVGGAQVAKQHANFIVNTGSASAADVVALIDHVQKVVYNNQGINLETEVRFLHEEMNTYEA